jgi:hypothetical protein
MEEADNKSPINNQPMLELAKEDNLGAKLKKLARGIIGLVMKHKIVSIVIVIIIVTALLVFNLLPVIAVGDSRIVNPGSVVRIERGQTVKLKYSDVSVKILNFSNTPCPEKQKCFGSGATVEYMLDINGKDYAIGSQTKASGIDYRLETVSTDYKTYADIKIIQL